MDDPRTDTGIKVARLLVITEAQDVKLDKILRCLYGDNGDSVGLKIQVDRLEQDRGRYQVWSGRAWAVTAAIVGLLGERIWSWIHFGKG